MFQQITMIDYRRPLTERAKARERCGPYRWTPAQPGRGRGFYQDSRTLACDARGSTFRLRLEEANDYLRGERLAYINGYFADNFQDTTLTPIIARLPRGRGFLSGWTMGEGMLAVVDCYVWEAAVDAARAAHDLAEQDADRERERAAMEDAELEAA